MRRWLALSGLAVLGLGCSVLVDLDALAPDGGVRDGASDAPGDDSGRADATTGCSWDAPFTNIHPLAGIPGAVAAAPQLRRDELVIDYQLLEGLDSGAPHYVLMEATRADRTSAFGAGVPLAPLNQADANTTNPSVSADGLFIVFASNRQRLPGTQTDLFVARRSAPVVPFAAPTPITQLGVSDPTGSPFVTSDQKELWFSVNVDGGAPTTYLAPVFDGGFQAAAPRADVPGWFAVLSDDKRTVYFSAGTSSTTNAIRVAHRQGVLDAFPAANLVNELNQSGESPGFLSPDQCRLYFTTRRNGGADVYVAERTP